MATMKCKVNDDHRKVQFECIKVGEVFIFMDAPMIKVDKVYGYSNVVNLENGQLGHIEDDALVTYVENAQLSIDI